MEELEDLAMGIKPAKKEKVKLGKGTEATLAAIKKIIEGIESESIADYKKYPKADQKALRKAYHELSEACYTARTLIREACDMEDKADKPLMEDY